MRWRFRSVKPPVKLVEEPPQFSQTDKLKEMLADLRLATDFQITRTDYHEAVIQALLDTHPELLGHPIVVDFFKRAKEYQAMKLRRP